jgi:hypothetical protein
MGVTKERAGQAGRHCSQAPDMKRPYPTRWKDSIALRFFVHSTASMNASISPESCLLRSRGIQSFDSRPFRKPTTIFGNLQGAQCSDEHNDSMTI